MQSVEEVLAHYGIRGQVVGINDGPLLRQIVFQPEAGTKLRDVLAAEDDIAREMGVSSLRVEALDGTNAIALEIPAVEIKTVDFREILGLPDWENLKETLPLCLGVDTGGRPVFADLAKMPHLLVAGTTGSRKSVGLNTFILSLMKAKKPSELKFVLIDPKRIEFGVYNKQRYLLTPVVTDNALAAETLCYLVSEMERRYSLFEENMAKNIADYNRMNAPVPYIVCVVDEFADLSASDKNVSGYIQLLAQKARACGIHIILATQRPSVDVVTGVLKANFPTRLSYKVASVSDSRTILDAGGAEKLLGRGDALFLASDGGLKRVHGAYMPDDAIAAFLEPYRGEVKPLPLADAKKEKNAPVSEKNSAKSWFRRFWDFWTSLRQRDKKVIINGVTALIGLMTSGRKKR